MMNMVPCKASQQSEKNTSKTGLSVPFTNSAFEERTFGILLKGPKKMVRELKGGIGPFYAELAEVNNPPFEYGVERRRRLSAINLPRERFIDEGLHEKYRFHAALPMRTVLAPEKLCDATDSQETFALRQTMLTAGV